MSRVLGVAVLAGLVAWAGLTARAQDNPPTEYQVKAAFLYKFGEFVEWPTNTFDHPSAPLVIGIFGSNPIYDELQHMVQGKAINGHPLEVREIKYMPELKACNILFISPTEKKRLGAVLGEVAHSAVLTVSEMDDFTDAGGMINFVIEGGKIRFEINADAAQRAGVKISAKLLALARHANASGFDEQDRSLLCAISR